MENLIAYNLIDQFSTKITTVASSFKFYSQNVLRIKTRILFNKKLKSKLKLKWREYNYPSTIDNYIIREVI